MSLRSFLKRLNRSGRQRPATVRAPLWLESLDERITPSTGKLDPSFDADGIVRTGFSTSSEDETNAVAIQSDGRIVAVGDTTLTTTDIAVSRYLSNGALDTTFSGDGKLTIDYGNGNTFAEAVAIQPDGKIVIAGSIYINNFDFMAIRLNTDGTLDTNFGANGKVVIDFGFDNDFASGVIIRGDGKIILTGYGFNGQDNDFAVARLNANGVLDTSFDDDGKLFLDVEGNNNSEFASAGGVDANGNIVIVGSISANNYDIAIARITADGDYDTTFSTDGKAVIDLGGDERGQSLAFQADSRIIIGGTEEISGNRAFVARLQPTGQLDTNFDTDGYRFIDGIKSNTLAEVSVRMHANQRILVAGSHYINTEHDFAIARLTTTGSLDTTFDGDGIAYGNLIGDDLANDIIVQSNQQIIVAGSNLRDGDKNFGLTRHEGGINIAPVLNTPTITIANMDEDVISASGVLVSSFATTTNITDANVGALRGIAITSGPTVNGRWQYSTNNGVSWIEVGTRSTTSARLLFADNLTRIRYVPTLNFNGTGTFTYRVWDRTIGVNGGVADTSGSGGTTSFSSASGTIQQRVLSVNDVPVNRVNSGITIYRNRTLAFSGNNRITISDVDAGGSQVSVTLTVLSGSSRGTLAISNISGLASVTGNNTSSMRMVGTMNAINSALTFVSYVAPRGFIGAVDVQVLTSDLGASGSGGAKTDTDTIRINVVNRAPVVKSPLPSMVYSTSRNTTLSVSTSNGVMRAFTDPDGDTLTAVLVTAPPSNRATVAVNANGSFVFAPRTNITGLTTFTVRVSDGNLLSATITITVNVV